ncbi:MAG: hypothetical protein U0Q11_22655 [Vicinamibacterales bacterium]
MMPVRSRLVAAGLIAAASLALAPRMDAQRRTAVPDLQGIWLSATSTPLQRPANMRDKAKFTPEEAEAYRRGTEDRLRARLPGDADRVVQNDLDEQFVETEVMPFDDMRTSLIVDPPNGMLPPVVAAAQARVAARPKRTFEGPETFGLGERCLVAIFGLGGSLAVPPLVPSEVIAPYYQIVQTPTTVMLYAEWIHDVRVIRLNGTHLNPSIRKWLGDSIGHYEGNTLVVDTTNFRPETHYLDSSQNMHVVERFTRVDAKTLRYRVTVDDPDTWSAPWTAEWSFRATDKPLFEVACHEANYSMENFLRGARDEERRQVR